MKKGKKKKQVEEEPQDELMSWNFDQLQKELETLKQVSLNVQTSRNYIQQETDMINQFYKSTADDLQQTKSQMYIEEAEMQKLQENQRVDERVYQQKVKHLEFDKEKTAINVREKAVDLVKEEENYHEHRIEDLKNSKKDTKEHSKKEEVKNVADIKKKQQQNDQALNYQQQIIDAGIRDEIDGYQKRLERLRAELELKLKVELHEIEERKNQHINDLMIQHEHSYNELKNFYNEQTQEHLKLIQEQKSELDHIKRRIEIHNLRYEEMKKHLRELRKEQRSSSQERKDLMKEVSQYPKNIMSLKNLKVKALSLQDNLQKLSKDKQELEKKYKKYVDEKDYLEKNFTNLGQEVRSNAEIQNNLLDKNLQSQNQELEKKEEQLREFMEKCKDTQLVAKLTEQVKLKLEAKNNYIKSLQYMIHHATKRYNDAIRVYEAKLVEFGIPPEELGFQEFETITSVMPAGLVSN